MSGEDTTSNTSSVDTVATVVAATNTDVSASLTSAVLTDSSSSISAASSVTSGIDSTTSLGSAAESLASAYSNAVLSSLDQTYYAGTLTRAAAVSYAATTAPTQTARTYTIDTSVAQAITTYATMSNAASAQHAILYYDTGSSAISTGVKLGGVGTGAGNIIFRQDSSLNVNTGGSISVTSGNQLLVGNVASANLALGYSGATYALQMASSSYLSATGYVGGVADKSDAGTSLGLNQTGLRTNAISTADDVVMDIGGDWGTVGDYRAATAAIPVPKTVIGNNNKITTGGNIGVFLNASVTVGSNVTMNVATNGGSGFFVGSGAYYSAGAGGNYVISGGMGAAYSNTTTLSRSVLYLGSNTSVSLQNANWGNFAAQGGAIISAGDGFNLRALALSVGNAQDPNTGGVLSNASATGAAPAVISIGNNAIISLGQNGLQDNSSGFYLGSDGTITIDGASDQLTIGTGAQIRANTISIGNFSKDYSGYNPQIGSNMNYSWFRIGSANTVTIGSGATIVLSGGIALDGMDNTLILAGGGSTGNILNAGFISAGGFYKAYNTAISGSNYVYSNTSGANVTFGDGYTITLTSAVISTGLTNLPTISNNGNLEDNTVNGIFTFGSNVTLTANSVVVGDYYLSRTNPYTSTVITSSAATTGASLTYGNSATLMLSGALLLNGASNKMIFGDALTLSAATISLGSGVAGNISASLNNVFSTGANANITLNSGFIDNQSNGVVQFGSNTTLTLSAGDLALGGAGTTAALRNYIHMAGNNKIILSNGSILMTNSNQTFDWTSNGIVSATTLSISGDNQSFTMGSSANVTLTGGVLVNAKSAALTFGNGTSMTVGNSGIIFNTSTNFIYGTGGYLSVDGNITFAAGATNTIFNIGANATLFKANSVVINATTPKLTFGTGINYSVTEWDLNVANNNVVLGNGATGSLGNIVVGTSATGVVFNTGSATNLTFGSASLVNNAALTLNGVVSGQTLNLAGTATVTIPAGAKVGVGSLVMDGSQQVTISVAAGATLDIGAISTTNVGSTLIPKIVVNGGTVVLDGQTVSASTRDLALTTSASDAYVVDFAGVANGVYQYTGDISEVNGTLNVTNFVLTDKLIFDVGSSYSDESRFQTSYADGVLTVSYVNADYSVTTLGSFDYTPAATGQALPNVLLTNGGTDSATITITKCFLTGTHILTPEGEVVVENIKLGDVVTALQDGRQVNKRVVWVGHMDVDVNNYEHKDTLYPVRIKAHAFGLNQPCRDLLVTPEHTIYVDGGLIPARMLVNGRSIIVDKTLNRFTVYHIETGEHSILLSENLTTESYLNTDDRHLFNGIAMNLHLTFNENAGHQSWENDAAAPLTVARDQVEPIWQRLDHRATQQGYKIPAKPEVTKDPALCLITQSGEKLQPVDIKGNTYSFYVPANVCVVAMHSKAALPSEVVGPFLDDRRKLGVQVSKISVFGDRIFDIIPADMADLSGWYPADVNRTDRWTKGLAILPEVVSEVSNKVKLIKIELTSTSEYFVDMIETAEKIA